MIKIFKNFFENEKSNEDNSSQDLELLCGLMIEAANTDGVIDNEEIEKIKFILVNTFQEEKNDVKVALNQAIKNRKNSKSLFFTHQKLIKFILTRKKFYLLKLFGKLFFGWKNS